MNLVQRPLEIGARQRDNALRPLLLRLGGGEKLGGEDLIRLVITIKSEDVRLRDLSAYLSLIDRCYGRLTSKRGLSTYSHRANEQIVARTISAGSIEIELIELASSSKGMALIAIWMLLRHLPAIIKALPEGAKQLAEAYSAFEDGRLKRENRRQIRLQVQRDAEVQQLDKPDQQKLVVLLEKLLERESDLVHTAERFSDEAVKSLDISVVKRTAHDENSQQMNQEN